ncbi:MAG: hypothetical protein J5750_08410 [Clostridiales bacterium]|nr:hypothetical protein [Clostridiales bacterium]
MNNFMNNKNEQNCQQLISGELFIREQIREVLGSSFVLYEDEFRENVWLAGAEGAPDAGDREIRASRGFYLLENTAMFLFVLLHSEKLRKYMTHAIDYERMLEEHPEASFILYEDLDYKRRADADYLTIDINCTDPELYRELRFAFWVGRENFPDEDVLNTALAKANNRTMVMIRAIISNFMYVIRALEHDDELFCFAYSLIESGYNTWDEVYG